MGVNEVIHNFHFLRPLWLLAIVPAVVLVWLLIKQKGSAGSWRGAISEHLLDYLSDGVQGSNSRAPFYLLLAGWIVAALALAGPAWNKLPQPVEQRQDALVIVLDLSLSMLSEDIKPSRLIRARHKILDILDQRREGLTALVAYSGDAHAVTPLTDDTPTIANLVPALSPLMMPVVGSDPLAAMKVVKQLFDNAGVPRGRVLLITDGITDKDVNELGDSLLKNGLDLSILGVGTKQGAPIPSDNGFLTDNNGRIIVPKLRRAPLEKLAADNDGRYTDITLGDRDIHFLLPPLPRNLKDSTIVTKREFDQWQDRGPLLAMLLLPLALAAFRRGWLLTLVLPLLLAAPQKSYAMGWRDLWQRPDQQGAEQMQAGNPKAAAKAFKDPAWKGSAQYRARDYEAAAKAFSSVNSADANYNRGNALARAGKYQQAIDAYDQALAMNPDMQDAQFNKKLVKKLLDQKKQKQNQKQQNQNNKQNKQGKSGQDKQQNGQQSQQQQSKSGQQQKQNGQQKQQSQQNGKSSQSDKQQNSQNQQQNRKQQSAADKQQQDKQQAAQSQAEQDRKNQDKQNAKQKSMQAQKQNDDQQDKNSAKQAAQQQKADSEIQQQRQATEQWLRRIPDDPSGLLRRKFNYESQLHQQQGESRQEQPQW